MHTVSKKPEIIYSSNLYKSNIDEKSHITTFIIWKQCFQKCNSNFINLAMSLRGKKKILLQNFAKIKKNKK